MKYRQISNASGQVGYCHVGWMERQIKQTKSTDSGILGDENGWNSVSLKRHVLSIITEIPYWV